MAGSGWSISFQSTSSPEGTRGVHRERQRSMCACIVEGAVNCTAAGTFSKQKPSNLFASRWVAGRGLVTRV